jgi:hypothetical protein
MATLKPEHSCFEFEIAIEKLKMYKLSGADQILAELIQEGSTTYIPRSTSLIILFGIRKNRQSSRRNLLLYLCLGRAVKLTNNYQGISLFFATYKTLPIILL